MVGKVLAAIRRHRLIVPGQHVLVAVSGGADSVALLALLRLLASRLRLRLTVAHLDHRIRGSDAREDARFVRRLARRFRLRCVAGSADVPALARRRHLSLETAARLARYEFLCRTAHGVRAQVIATAHHADDQAETVLIRFLRGAGTRGLSGIPRVSLHDGIPVVRPLLDIRRAEIVRFLARRRLDWREDATNADPVHLRNRVRHELLPELERQFNPAIRDALIRMADILREDERWMETGAREALERHRDPADGRFLATADWSGEPLAVRRRVLRLWLASGGFPVDGIEFDTVERVDALMRSRKGNRALSLPGGWSVRRLYGRLSLAGPGRMPVEADPVGVRIPGVTRIPSLGLRVITRRAPGIVRSRPACPGVLPEAASLSLQTLGRRALRVRSWRPGDRMRPFGMDGSRKLQDILTDAKVPRDCRGRIPVFVCGGDVVWLPGYRIARGWEVPDSGTPALQVRVEAL